jgi:uncharacterized protein
VAPGDACRLEFTKWGDQPHWEMDAVYLGSDDHGDWLGYPVGTYMSRPGLDLVSTNPQVGLVPAAGMLGRAWVATFHGPGGPVATYVDVSTPAEWSGSVVRAVDLDLDVVEPLEASSFDPASFDPAPFDAESFDVEASGIQASDVEASGVEAFVDDEDEFALHSVSLGYPPEIVELALASRDLLLTAVRAHVPPFDGAHLPWLDRLAALRPA